MRSLRMALAFLTRVPLTPADGGSLPTTGVIVAFPIAGLLIGGLAGGSYWLAVQLLPTTPAAAIAVGVGMLVTGAFHEDGLADTFDALGGGRDRDAVFRIFKDSRLGTFGVAALVLSILLRVTSLAALDGLTGLVALTAAHGLARSIAAATMGVARPAGAGLGTSLMSGISRRHSVVIGTIGLAIGAILLGVAGVAGFVVAAAGAVILTRWATGKVGGVNGDVLGAIEQIGELAVLVAAAAAVGHWNVPWWG